ncbi:phosphoribosylformylglycinamidine synthase subunit PurQ, partial [Nanoarchaeota archaeon]
MAGSSKYKIAVMLFPGTNCENETKRAVEAVGMNADIVRWNQADKLAEYDGYVLAGGWSYEDRVRAGVISAKDPVMKTIANQAAKGKPVLGICNGAQVLVETGLVPGINNADIDFALAPNINPKISGFYCVWTTLKNKSPKKTAFTMNINEGELLPMPIAHGEGRFTTSNEDVLNKLID